MRRTFSRSVWIALSGAAALYATSLTTSRKRPGARSRKARRRAATPHKPARRQAQGRRPTAAAGAAVEDAADRTKPIPPTPTPTSRRRAPVLPLTPDEQAKHFILPPAIELELVLADPEIEEPTAIAFDGNGRMFVLEDRGYMQDADAGGERDPVGRISVHEDVEQRRRLREAHASSSTSWCSRASCMPFGANSVLTMETDADEVWKYTDTNSDGVADKKELFATGFGRAGNVEHQQSFLTWAMDNWLYSTVNAFRARWTPNGVLQGADRIERRAVGRDAGQRRQDVVPGRRQRHARRTSSSRSSTATSTCPISSRRTSRFRGARRCASPTCRAACRPCACPTARSTA